MISIVASDVHIGMAGAIYLTMLTFLEANGVSVRIPPEVLASTMIDLQKRSEAGEDVSRLIAGIASVLAKRHTKRQRP